MLSLTLLCLSLAPGALWACACGCGIFDVGTSGSLPLQPGGFAYFEFDYLNQNQNRTATHKAPAENNNDKQVRTGFFTAGVQYMIDRRWGFMAELPYWDRYFKTTDGNGNEGGFTHGGVGDIRLRGVYSGFSSDMSTGLTFGLKLPTGDIAMRDLDRDTQIGTGSTDLLLGLYHMGRIVGLQSWNWFGSAQLDRPLLTAGGYRPGSEADAVLGVYYEEWKVGRARVAPIASVVGSLRGRDGGTLGRSPDTGYTRVVVAPGLEVGFPKVRVYGDVGFPVYQFVNGNQLLAAHYFKLRVGYAF